MPKKVTDTRNFCGCPQCIEYRQHMTVAAPSVSQRSEVGSTDWMDEIAALCKQWAANDGLWTTQETVECNLGSFANEILKITQQGGGVSSSIDSR